MADLTITINGHEYRTVAVDSAAAFQQDITPTPISDDARVLGADGHWYRYHTEERGDTFVHCWTDLGPDEERTP